MGGVIAGACQGMAGMRADLVKKAWQLSSIAQDKLAERLILSAQAKFDSEALAHKRFAEMGRQLGAPVETRAMGTR